MGWGNESEPPKLTCVDDVSIEMSSIEPKPGVKEAIKKKSFKMN